MTPSYVYLLVDAATENRRFKIGFSNDPYSRLSGIPQQIDLGASAQVECDAEDAQKLERTLHFLFRQYRATVAPGSGYTEWFHIDCFEMAKDFLREHSAILLCGPITPVLRLTKIPKPRAPRRQWSESDRATILSASKAAKSIIDMLVEGSIDHAWTEEAEDRDCLTGLVSGLGIIGKCVDMLPESRLSFPDRAGLCNSMSLSWEASGDLTAYRLHAYSPKFLKTLAAYAQEGA